MSHKKKKRRKQKLSSSKKKSIQRKSASSRLPFDISAELRKAFQYLQSGQLQTAERIYKNVLGIVPNHSECLYLLGITSHQLGKTDTAVNLINKAIVNDPKNPSYHNDLGNVLKDQGELDEAISCYQKALELRPDFAEVYYNMGIVFQDEGKLDEAISCYQKALELRPDFAEAYNHMGNVFQDQSKLDQAISCYKKALQLKPGYPEAYNNMGTAFKHEGELNEAISCYQKALQLKPDYVEASYNMGVAFQRQDKLNEAISCYQKALQLKPDYVEGYANLVRLIEMTCTWQKLQGLTEKMDNLTNKALDSGTKPAEHPFINVTRHADLSRNFAIAKSWSSDITRRVSSLKIHFSFDDKRSSKTRIAVGYLSNDFHDHATAHLMLSLFGLHNRDEFDIFCYSYGQDDGSCYRKRIQGDCDKFVDIRDLSHADAARCIYEDQVDILIDLKAYVFGSRLAICALRPAPIQVSYLGFPGTTGAEFIDYIITDKNVTPDDHACYFSENFVYLPHCYQVNDNTQAISSKDWEKTHFGLPEAGFVFCSFNQGYKIDPVMFEAWMQILRQVPESILWLQPGNEIAERNLRREAEERGVDPERLIFGEWLPKDEHLARIGLADLALDTRICNGHTTTSDALWAGVPVITLQGSHFASRVSSSILTAVGLPELITHTLEEYESLAVRLSRNQDELHSIRQRLSKNRLTEPLFDTPRFAKNLETAYKEMWKIYSAGEAPRQIRVVDNQ